MTKFEKQIRHALIDREMKVSDLAEQLDINVSYLYDIMNDARKAEHQRQRIREFLCIEGEDGEDDEEQTVGE